MPAEPNETTGWVCFEFSCSPHSDAEDTVDRLARKTNHFASMLHELHAALQAGDDLEIRARWEVALDGETKDSGAYEMQSRQAAG